MSKPTEGKLLPKQEFYMYVGLCITAWAKIEEELFNICVDALGCTQERASIVYYRTPTVRSRMDLVDELVSTVIPRPKKDGAHPHEDTKTWRGLKKKLADLSEVRRKIAHQPVNNAVAIRNKQTGELIKIGESMLLDRATYEHSYWIYMSHAESLRGRGIEHHQLKTDDLAIHCAELETIVSKIKSFREQKLRAHIQESARQESMHQMARKHPNVVLTIGKPKPHRPQREKP
jgi:hypothetical protein